MGMGIIVILQLLPFGSLVIGNMILEKKIMQSPGTVTKPVAVMTN